MARSFADAFGIPTIVTGVVLVVALALIIFGGVKRVAEGAEARLGADGPSPRRWRAKLA